MDFLKTQPIQHYRYDVIIIAAQIIMNTSQFKLIKILSKKKVGLNL